MIQNLIKHERYLDILFNIAGIMREGTVEETDLIDCQDQITVNLTIPYLMIKYALSIMRGRGCAIVIVGSIEGLGSNPRQSAYCASKAGLHALTSAVTVDHGPEGIRCNAVAPGWIDTPLNVDFINSQPEADQFKTKIDFIHPLRRTGTPEEVAKLIVWLASDQASFMTGCTLDGGASQRPQMKVTSLPQNPGPAAWNATCRRKSAPSLLNEVTADWLIVGAGFAGFLPQAFTSSNAE